MLNDHFEAEKNGDESSTMLHYVRLGSNLKTLQFDEDTGPVLQLTLPNSSSNFTHSELFCSFEPIQLIINQLSK